MNINLYDWDFIVYVYSHRNISGLYVNNKIFTGSLIYSFSLFVCRVYDNNMQMESWCSFSVSTLYDLFYIVIWKSKHLCISFSD